MESEHYKRNDSILYLLVVISICLSIVSIVMQFNLRSKASQAAVNTTIQNQGTVANPPISTNSIRLSPDTSDCSRAPASCQTACVLTNEARTDAAQAASIHGASSVYAQQLAQIAKDQAAFYAACLSNQ